MAAEVRFKKELLDELLTGHDAKTVFAQDALLDDLKKALASALSASRLPINVYSFPERIPSLQDGAV